MIFYERASGARMHANYFRVGGVHQDLPPKLLDDIWAFCDPFLQVCDDLEGLLTENRIFKQRNVDIAEIKLADAWGWGFSGVMVRGSVPLGTCVRRSLTNAIPSSIRYPRWQERRLLRSLSGAHGRDAPVGAHHEAVPREARLPEGQRPIFISDNKIVPQTCAEMKRSMEATIHHFKLYSEGHHVPAGEVYAAVEARRVSSASTRRGWHQPALQVQDPGAVIRPPFGDGFFNPWPYARRCLGDHRLARHRFREDRSMSVRFPLP